MTSIDLRDDWLGDVEKATGDLGTNDDEHYLLLEVADLILKAHERAQEAERDPTSGFPQVVLALSLRAAETAREGLETVAGCGCAPDLLESTANEVVRQMIDEIDAQLQRNTKGTA